MDRGAWQATVYGVTKSWTWSNMLLEKSRGQILIAPERMKCLGQSRDDAQLQVCLVVKVKFDDVKNSTA